MFSWRPDGPLHTLSLLEELRVVTSAVWDGTASLHQRVDKLLRERAAPKVADIPMHLPFRVELWDRSEQHLRWVVSASSSVAMAHAAFDVAVATYPRESLTLRNGALVIRKHVPDGSRY
jgi:hypothetical protein